MLFITIGGIVIVIIFIVISWRNNIDSFHNVRDLWNIIRIVWFRCYLSTLEMLLVKPLRIILLHPRRVRANSRSHSTPSLARHFRTHSACSYSHQPHKWLKKLQSLEKNRELYLKAVNSKLFSTRTLNTVQKHKFLRNIIPFYFIDFLSALILIFSRSAALKTR